MQRFNRLLLLGVGVLWSASLMAQSSGQFAGRILVTALANEYTIALTGGSGPNPGELPAIPGAPEDCANGVDDNENGLIDYGTGVMGPEVNGDPDCRGGISLQDVLMRTPFAVVQPVNGAEPAWFNGTDRNADNISDLQINSTGVGGLKHSYLRTSGNNSYSSIHLRALILPGLQGDQGGPLAAHIQESGESYYARVVPGETVAIMKDNGDGTSTVLSEAPGLQVDEYDAASPTCYQVNFTVELGNQELKVDEVNDCSVGTIVFTSIENRLATGTSVSTTSSDNSLASGWFGLRSHNDASLPGGVDTLVSKDNDPSVLDLHVSNPNDQRDPNAPTILMYNGGFGHDFRDRFDYSDGPVTARQWRLFNRSGGPVSEGFMANKLREWGFNVIETPFSSFGDGIFTPEEVNNSPDIDLWWASGAGASSSTRGFVREITKPIVLGEHVAGSPEWGGFWSEPNNGGHSPLVCGEAPNCAGEILPGLDYSNCQGNSTVKVFGVDQFGAPGHPIVRNLADANGNIVIADARVISENLRWEFPGEFLSLNGHRIKSQAEVLTERGWADAEGNLGIPEAQMAGWPPAGAEDGTGWALAGFVDCDGNALRETDPGRGHVSFIAIEAGTPRGIRKDQVEACPAPCEFESRVVFGIPYSDRNIPYATTAGLELMRRSLLWALNLLNSPNRSATLFTRGDADANGSIELTDAVFTFNALFVANSPQPSCDDAADSNDDESLDLSDGIFTLNFLFLGGLRIPSPGVRGYQSCGLDFTPAFDQGEVANPSSILSCDAYSGCPNA